MRHVGASWGNDPIGGLIGFAKRRSDRLNAYDSWRVLVICRTHAYKQFACHTFGVQVDIQLMICILSAPDPCPRVWHASLTVSRDKNSRAHKRCGHVNRDAA